MKTLTGTDLKDVLETVTFISLIAVISILFLIKGGVL